MTKPKEKTREELQAEIEDGMNTLDLVRLMLPDRIPQKMKRLRS